MRKTMLTIALIAATSTAAGMFLLMPGCGGGSNTSTATTDTNTTVIVQPSSGLVGDRISPLLFANPYAHIPAQCHIETSRGTQNACQFCHTNAAWHATLGNNNPQAGAEPLIGNLQLEYSFTPYDTTAPIATINRWENTLRPEVLRDYVQQAGFNPHTWDMLGYIRQDNWSDAFAQRPGDPRSWDGGEDVPFRVFPGLDPADLPADNDGFVRSAKESNSFFRDGMGWVSGWRSVNFMPYGIFTPMTGSVSGIYIRLPANFMQNEGGAFDLETYKRNLDLVERNIQDRLRPEDGSNYIGAAKGFVIERGLYPLGTEFAHPLHYVDVRADGSNDAISPFPGTRARRVKEVRYMYKYKAWHPTDVRPAEKEEGTSIYGNDAQGWVDNGVGWYLAGFIEDASGKLRPQTREELAQCIGCHSGINRTEFPTFTSGTGNTVDSTWAMPRKFAGDAGWKEMNYLGYTADSNAAADATPGHASLGDPLNRNLGKGEMRYFLETVVGASLYGDMPPAIERFMTETVRTVDGYSQDWPAINTSSAVDFNVSHALRQQLMRELTARGGHLEANGALAGEVLYPPENDALAAAARYRQVVVTQRFKLGKDVFPETPLTFKYFRQNGEEYPHLDGQAYSLGEVITDRPIDLSNPADITYRVGSETTLIDEGMPYSAGGNYNPEYLPLLRDPLVFESKP